MIAPEVLERYFEKSKDTQLEPSDYWVENEHGFIGFNVNQEGIVITQAFGDGKYWDQYIVDLAKQLNLPYIFCATKRSPKAYQRKYGCDIIGYILRKEV